MKTTTKRFLAYIIDMIIVLGIVFLIKLLFPININEVNLSNLNEQYLAKNITYSEYMDSYIPIVHNIDKSNVGINLIAMIVLVLFFIIIPNLKNGQTIGCMIFKIKIVSEKLTIEQLVGRSVIINGLGYMIIMFLSLYLLNDKIYFYLINFLAFFQIIVVLINGFMVLYKEKHQGIADNLTKTRIEEIK